jgi:hypothetical protein
LPRKGHEALADKLKLPKFASEAEEAQWWYDHREEVNKAFEDTQRNIRAQTLIVS